MRNVAEIVSSTFIWGVGITRPKPGQERRAARYITMMLLGTVIAIIGAFFLLLARF
jgi:hypothetical protein